MQYLVARSRAEYPGVVKVRRLNPKPSLAVLSAFGVVAMAGGCMRVPPAPVDLPERASARVAGGLDVSAIAVRAAALAPGTPRPEAGIDRLALFAAILTDDPRVAAARAGV